MKRTSIAISLIAALFGCIVIYALLVANNVPDKDMNNNDDAGKTEENIMTEESDYSGIHIVTDIQEQEQYKMALHYPQFNNETLDPVVDAYVNELKQDFLDEVEQNQSFLIDRAADFNLSFDIYPVVEHVYSIVFTKGSYVSGANGSVSIKVLLVDIANGNYIPQTEIIVDNDENRDAIYDLLLQEFQQSEQYKEYFFKDYLKQWIDNKGNNFSNVYIKNRDLVFRFDKYEVTAGAAGTPEIVIPIDDISFMLSDEWKIKLKVNTEEIEEPIQQKPEPTKQPVTEPDAGKPSSSKIVALTFDDGPHPKNTISILELLEKYDAKATFFMLGNRVDFYSSTAKAVAAKGHEIGNHTWDHKDLTKLEPNKTKSEIEKTSEIILSATGQKPTVFRPPYGAINSSVREAVTLPVVLWDVDTLDWKSHNPEDILSIVKQNVEDGSIILMHDIHASTVEALELVLEYLDKQGYEFVTVSELDG